MKRKKPTVSSLKKKLWKIFSIYIRRKYSDPETEIAECVTCGIKKPWREQQSGHIVPGRGNSILFDERGVFVQCIGCNVYKYGNTLEYIDFMKRHYGEEKGREIIEELRILSKQPKSFTVPELEYMIRDYEIRVGRIE